MKTSFKIIGTILIVLYPVFVFLCLVVFHLPISIMAMGMLILAALYFSGSSKGGKNKWSTICLAVIAIVVLITKSEVVLKFYPICITLVFLVWFGGSLLKGDPIVVKFATMMDKTINVHPAKKAIYRYCRNVTIVWVVWFILSEAMNVYLTFWGTTQMWAIFNAGISYIFQGGIFVIEFIVRYFVNKRLAMTYTLWETTEDSHPLDYVLCYKGEYEDEVYKTWKEYLCDVNALRGKISRDSVLEIKDLYLFNVAVAASLADNKEVRIGQGGDVTDEVVMNMIGDGSDVTSFERIDGSYKVNDKVLREVDIKYDFLHTLWSTQGFDEEVAIWKPLFCAPRMRIKDYFKKDEE